MTVGVVWCWLAGWLAGVLQLWREAVVEESHHIMMLAYLLPPHVYL